MKLFDICTALMLPVVPDSASMSRRPSNALRDALAPTGRLRVGLAFAPSKTGLFVVKDASGQPSGVTVDLGNAMGRQLGVPVEFVVASNTGELTNGVNSGAIDVAFMPVDDERKTKVDFGPAYFMIECTYLVRAGLDIKTLAEVDTPSMRVIGVANTATIRAATQFLKNTPITPVNSVQDCIAQLRSAQADAFALTHDALPPLAQQLLGSRILEGYFLQTNVSIAVPKNRPQALAYVTTFLEEAKANGLVRRALDDAGMQVVPVAAPTATAR
jgi:polar amino acid transport system substrate-binding protein